MADETDIRKGDWMQTYTGKQFWPLDPRMEDIDMLDIAHALSLQCRYNGHCTPFYSVAEHSWHLSYLVPKKYALEALLHDAAEAYVSDVPRPLKRFLPNYVEIEQKVEQVIARMFNLEWPWPPEVKEADTRILLDEQRALMQAPPADWDIEGEPFGITLFRFDWWHARQRFMQRACELTAERFGEAA